MALIVSDVVGGNGTLSEAGVSRVPGPRERQETWTIGSTCAEKANATM